MAAASVLRAVPGALARHAVAVAFGAGAVLSLAFAPWNLWPLAPACLALLWWLWRGCRPGRAAAIGGAFGAGLYLAGTYWLYTSIHVFGKAPLALAVFLMLGLVAIMASYTALLGWLVARLVDLTRPTEAVLGLAVLPGGWVLMEWLRGWLLSGFPWLAVGYSAIDTPLAHYAPLVGVYGVSLVLAVSAGSLWVLVTAAGQRPRLLALLAIGVPLLGGAGLGRIEWTHPSAPPLAVALVQPSIPQDLKWQDDNQGPTLELYRRLTASAWGAPLVVWPEASLPLLYHEALPFLAEIYREAERQHASLLLGLVRYDFDTAAYRNGLVALAGGEQWYYKRRLVPFGEFFPVPAFVREWMRLKSLAYVDMQPGPADQPPLAAAGQQLAATICYEDAYGAEQLGGLATATLLVNVSNDAWFGDSTAPHQHLQIARMRALEAGRWMIRATNNGISALIGPDGEVRARSRQFVPEVLKGEVVPRLGLTPYARLGNVPVLVACLVLIGLVALAWFRSRYDASAAEERPHGH